MRSHSVRRGCRTLGLTRVRVRSGLVLLALAPSLTLASAAAGTEPQNFLIIVIDDIGVDKVGAYREGECHAGACPRPPATPNIDRLAAEGVLFRNAYSNPLCSASRASLLTGRHAFRTGIGGLTASDWDSRQRTLGLDPSEPNLANRLRASGYETAAFGKWHMAGCTDVDPETRECTAGGSAYYRDHPVRSGFDYYAGNLANLSADGGDYCNWVKVTASRSGPGGADSSTFVTRSQTYSTSDTAAEAIAKVPTLKEPWFAWVAFSAAHRPLHVVPNEDQGCASDESGDMVEMSDGMVTRLDREIGHLLAALRERSEAMARTSVILISDNGTFSSVTLPPFVPRHAKATPFEGGINVPFIVAGAAVSSTAAGRESAALVSSTDVFATITELAGLPLCADDRACAEDSVSFSAQLKNPEAASARSFVFAEAFPNTRGFIATARQSIRGPRFKIVRRYGGPVPGLWFYDIERDPFESSDLLVGVLSEEAAEEFARLGADMRRLVGACIERDDIDGDCVRDTVDNCRAVPNGPAQAAYAGVGNQLDSDGDGKGDACARRRRPGHDAHAMGNFTKKESRLFNNAAKGIVLEDEDPPRSEKKSKRKAEREAKP